MSDMIERPIIKFRKTSEDAIIPSYATDGSNGFDLYSMMDGKLRPGELMMIPLGVEAEIPKDWCVVFIGKSGLASREGIGILGGLIDSDYRGEWHAILLNNKKQEEFVFHKRQKVVQGVILYSPQAKIVEVDSLSETERGKSGFGSTGK